MGMKLTKLDKRIFDSKWERMSNHNQVNQETLKEWDTLNAKLYEIQIKRETPR